MPPFGKRGASSNPHRSFGAGRRIETPLFRVKVVGREHGTTKFIFVAPRSADKRAVARNRLKRRGREYVRSHTPRFGGAYEIVVIFKKEAVLASRKKFYEELQKIITSIERR